MLGGNVDGVLRAFEDIELGVDRLFESLGFLPECIFGDYFIARMGHRVVGLGSHDQAEGLQIGGDVEFVFTVAAGENLAEVDGTSFRRDCPQNISKELSAESACGCKVVKLCANLQSSRFPVNLGATSDGRHEFRTAKVDCGRPSTM